MYIMCVCLFSALSRRVGALQISIIIIIKTLHIHGSQWRWGLESPQSIKNIASSVQEMCTVSFNCHPNVALGMETIPQSAQKCSHRSPTTKKWKHALLPEPFNHWPLYIIYIYIWNLTWGCDVTDTDVSEGTGSKSVSSNAVLHPIMLGLEKTTQFTKSESKKS